MKLSEYLSQGTIMYKKAKLKIDLDLNNGESRKSGDIVMILKHNDDGTFHAEDNDFACKLDVGEFEYID